MSNGDLQGPEQFRAYLVWIARSRLDPRLRGKLDPSDLVQQTLLRACQGKDGFRGESRPEQFAWLRQILARTMADAVRDLNRDKRDIGRERSLEVAIEESSARLHAWAVYEEASPSEMAVQNERAARLSAALERLPEDQRRAVTLKYCEGWPLAKIAAEMDRTSPSIASLLRRGLHELRGWLAEEQT